MFNVWFATSIAGVCVGLAALIWSSLDSARRIARIERMIGVRAPKDDSDD
jgi:hypothetical protein